IRLVPEVALADLANKLHERAKGPRNRALDQEADRKDQHNHQRASEEDRCRGERSRRFRPLIALLQQLVLLLGHLSRRYADPGHQRYTAMGANHLDRKTLALFLAPLESLAQ